MEKTTQQTENKNFHNINLQRDIEKHLNADNVKISKMELDNGWSLDINDDGYFYYSRHERDTDLFVASKILDHLLEHPAEQAPPTNQVSTVGYTQGEWKYKIYDNPIFKEIEIGVDGMRTCVIPYLEEPAEANAQRIVLCHNNHDSLVSALQDAMEDLKNLACNYAGYSTNEDKPAYIGKLASYAKAHDLLTRIKQ